jgi:hypothetical protein
MNPLSATDKAHGRGPKTPLTEAVARCLHYLGIVGKDPDSCWRTC